MAIDFHAPSNVGAYASRSAPAGGRSCVGPHLVGDTTPAPWVQADATSFRFREEEDGFAGWMMSGRDESESVPALVGAILRATAPLESESAAR